jgi:hypothetical protein
MNTPLPRRASFALLLLCLGTLAPWRTAGEDKVSVLRTPDDGIQPQVVLDGKGTAHLLYYKGKSGGGDLFYTRRASGEASWSKPIQVNSRPGDAIAAGTIRGGQLALGRDGQLHVAWNGSKSLEDSKHKGVPMWYSRLNDEGTAFEPERDLMTFTGFLDGGGSIAADGQGNVYVVWHAAPPDNSRGEAGRGVYLARSTDGGKTFAPEKKVSPETGGACGCCGMKALADDAGNVFAIYRAATAMVNRDEVLLVSRDRGATFTQAYAHPWNIGTCPMSSAWLTSGQTGVVAAWETAGQVYFARFNPKTSALSSPISPPGTAKRKHPVAATNREGETLLAWTEGTGWQKGGSLAWQLFDRKGQPAAEAQGRVPEAIPVWGLVAAFAQPDGRFVIVH